MLEKIENTNIWFQKYLRQYARFFIALTHDKDITVAKSGLHRKGQKPTGTTDWFWNSVVLNYEGKNPEGLPCNDSMKSPDEDLVAQFLAIYNALPNIKQYPMWGSRLETLVLGIPYTQESRRLYFSLKLEEEGDFAGPTRYKVALTLNNIRHLRKKTTSSQDIARLQYDEALGKNVFMTDKSKILRPSIGAVQDFLREMDASYRLSEPIPRDVYHALDHVAGILK